MVDSEGVFAWAMVPMTTDRASELPFGFVSNGFQRQLFYCSTSVFSLISMPTMPARGGWGEFWGNYWHYLTHPSQMDDELETGFYVAGGVGVGAGVVAGGIVAAPVVAGTTFTIPTIGVTTTTTTGIGGGGVLVAGGTVTTVTTGTVTVSGTTVVVAAGGGAILMSGNPLDHYFENPQHGLDDLVDAVGGPQQTFDAVKAGAQAVVDATGATGVIEIPVIVEGVTVTVRGRVIDGIFRVGTFFL